MVSCVKCVKFVFFFNFKTKEKMWSKRRVKIKLQHKILEMRDKNLRSPKIEMTWITKPEILCQLKVYSWKISILHKTIIYQLTKRRESIKREQ